MRLSAYKPGTLQDTRTLLVAAKREGKTIDQVIAAIDRYLPPASAVIPARPSERWCPECGRFVLVRPKGVAEPVLVCPSCRYSEYRGVR